MFFDLTLSLSKSISIFHASLGENARLAREAGDTAGEEYWSVLVAEVDAMIYQAVQAGFEYFQREAGYTRTGSHNARVNGQETGQWHEADLAVAYWLQHTSRDGDMQLHVHSQIAHVARTGIDGKWRAPDSLGYNEHIGAVGAITAQHLEEALTRRFGLEWSARDDGHGFEIKGISGQMMRLFSSRRESITADLRDRAKRFEQEYERAPSQRELAQLAQSSNFATRRHKEGALDTVALHRGWADKLTRTLGVPLASVAPSVWHGGPGHADPRASHAGQGGPVPEEVVLARAAQQALALAQQEKSTWTRADLVKYLGRVLPRAGRDPAGIPALLKDLADRTLRSEFESVLCLEAPEPVPVPDGLLRADGRSIYRRHGGTRYATRAQLTLEEAMTAQASTQGAPRLTRAAAARSLGADLARLENALAGRVGDARDRGTECGLREDQAAAALSVLTDGRRVSVINAPAGSGKTYVLGQLARAWSEAGLGPVIGITTSQSARNTLASWVAESYNSAQFLGHLPGRRGALGPIPTGPGPLLLVDEASMMSTPDLADLITLARNRSGKVVLAGDTMQLQAVASGGGMSMLAACLGHVRLTEPVRFRQEWERAASLRLRDGDTTVLADYDQHARIRGGGPEEMTDAAVADYVALTASGTDVLLMAASHSQRRELSRRIRDDLVRLGLVSSATTVAIADGDKAGPGDLIVATRNDHQVEAGEPGRTLANGDLLRVEAVTSHGLLVRRALSPDPRTGRRRWTERQFLYADFRDAQLGYAVTDHVAQGRTVHTGLALVTGTEDRQHAYVALTRGTDDNTAYVFTRSPTQADLLAGPRTAPELDRYDRRSNDQVMVRLRADRPETAIAVLAQVISRDGQQLSASHTRRQALSDADHLGILHAIWTAEATPAREQRYRQLLVGQLPPCYPPDLGHRAKWLWRTLHSAELAGADARQVLARAIGERDLVGARDVAAVIDARIRRREGSRVPAPAGSWSQQVPEVADPGQQVYLAQLAALMDARKARIGEHAATAALPWAVSALGPVPQDQTARAKWEVRAASVGAYRELSGYSDPGDPIGPEPAAGSPDRRAAWHEALRALGPAAGPDVHRMPDGLLLHLRATYPLETAWAPAWVGDQLRQVRAAARDAYFASATKLAEAAAAVRARDHPRAASLRAVGQSYQALADAYSQREAALATAADDRAVWEAATRQRRQAAVAADAELRRRHPDQRWELLRSAEPEPAAVPGEAPQEKATLAGIQAMLPALQELRAQHREFASKLAGRAHQLDSTVADRGWTYPLLRRRHSGAILQPPPPEIPPSPLILDRAAELDRDWEAGE